MPSLALEKPITAGVHFLYPLKTSESLRFSDVFSGYKLGTPASNTLKIV